MVNNYIYVSKCINNIFIAGIHMFIRAKTISGRNYAYLVRTRWDKRSKTVKQKVSKYLGPITKLDKVKDIAFFDYYKFDKEKYINEVKIERLVRDLAELELYRHGFIKLNSSTMTNGVHKVDIEHVSQVFELNEGFMNKHTLKAILHYDKILDENERRIPYKFAGLFVNAGLDIDKELFVELYQRLFSDSV